MRAFLPDRASHALEQCSSNWKYHTDLKNQGYKNVCRWFTTLYILMSMYKRGNPLQSIDFKMHIGFHILTVWNWDVSCNLCVYFNCTLFVNITPNMSLFKVDRLKIKGEWWQRVRWLDSITDSRDMILSKLREIVEDRGAWCAAVYGVEKNWTWISDWTITTTKLIVC